jgi:hypothetical protein
MVMSEGTTEKIPSETTGNRSRDRDNNVNKNITVEAKLISPST